MPRPGGLGDRGGWKEGDSGVSSEVSTGARTSVRVSGVGGCSQRSEWQRLNVVFSSAREGKPGGLRCVVWDLDGI